MKDWLQIVVGAFLMVGLAVVMTELESSSPQAPASPFIVPTFPAPPFHVWSDGLGGPDYCHAEFVPVWSSRDQFYLRCSFRRDWSLLVLPPRPRDEPVETRGLEQLPEVFFINEDN